MAWIAIIGGATLLSLSSLVIGATWWIQGVPLSKDKVLTGPPAKVASLGAIVFGVAIAIFGWVILPAMLRT
jgi:hypothetical protein